ncbi:MAG: hypothetical protein ACI8RZ_003389 [Myxococcota bacterium]|jgi:hypothetical protein
MIAGWLAGLGTAGAQMPDDIAAEVILDAPQIRVGEPVFFTFRVHNRGDESLWRVVGGDYRNALGRANSYQCVLQSASGTARAVPDAGFDMGVRRWCRDRGRWSLATRSPPRRPRASS